MPFDWWLCILNMPSVYHFKTETKFMCYKFINMYKTSPVTADIFPSTFAL